MIAQHEATAALAVLLPEAILAGGIVVTLAADMLLPRAKRGPATWLAIAACLGALVAAMRADVGAVGDLLVVDGIALLARPAILVATALVLLGGRGERRFVARDDDEGAWAASVAGIGLGALVAAAAANLVTLWLGLEMVSLASYALAAWRGGDRRAAEAGMKFVLFGGAASALTLFGASHVYGLTGHLDFAGIGTALGGEMPITTIAALCLAGVGIAYKLTLVPFHFYAPDVYQGAPALAVAAVSVAPKIGALAALARALELAVPATLVPPAMLGRTLAFVAVASLVFASFTALVQRDAKRIVAFSGIGHAGTALLALACLPGGGALAAAAYYLAAYGAANLGALVCLSVLERDRGSCALPALAGAIRSRPWVTAALCVFLFSLAGVPPLAGFLGKWGVLMQALGVGRDPERAELTWAAIALLITTAISAWSYLLVVRAAVLAPAPVEEAGPRPRLAPATVAALLACAGATVAIGLWLDGFAAFGRMVAS